MKNIINQLDSYMREALCLFDLPGLPYRRKWEKMAPRPCGTELQRRGRSKGYYNKGTVKAGACSSYGFGFQAFHVSGDFGSVKRGETEPGGSAAGRAALCGYCG